MSASFNIQPNGYIYLYHYPKYSSKPLKISTKVKIDHSQWKNNKEGLIDKDLKDENGKKIIDQLTKCRGALLSAIEECKHTRKDIRDTYEIKLSGVVLRGGGMAETKPKFLEFFEMKVTEFETDKKSNRKSYKTTYNNCVEFFKTRRPTFEDIDEKFFDDFNRFLEKTKDYKKNTINKQFTNIKAIVGKAYNLKIHSNQAYKGFKAGKERAVNVFLTIPELDKIYNLDFKNHLHIDRTRDSFIVAAFTGLRFGDLGRVRSDLIKDGVIKITSRKSFEVSQIPIHKYVKAILLKYGGVMPEQISNQKTNQNIKVICRVARLNGEYEKPCTKGGKRKAIPDRFKKWQMCTTHTARRSLCTNLILQGASPYVVMKISGHKTFDAFQEYIKLDELLAVDSLKKLPMFQDVKEKSAKVKKVRQPDSKVYPVTQSL